MENYNSVLEALDGLKAQGYTEDFNLQENCMVCSNGKYKLKAGDFLIDKHYRFEDNTDPSDQSIIYAISSDKYDVKGILINAYGIYSDDMANDMIEALSVRK